MGAISYAPDLPLSQPANGTLIHVSQRPLQVPYANRLFPEKSLPIGIEAQWGAHVHHHITQLSELRGPK